MFFEAHLGDYSDLACELNFDVIKDLPLYPVTRSPIKYANVQPIDEREPAKYFKIDFEYRWLSSALKISPQKAHTLVCDIFEKCGGGEYYAAMVFASDSHDLRVGDILMADSLFIISPVGRVEELPTFDANNLYVPAKYTQLVRDPFKYWREGVHIFELSRDHPRNHTGQRMFVNRYEGYGSAE